MQNKLPEINKEIAFQLYAQFAGDVERTSHVLGAPPADVIELATSQGWDEKLKGILELKKSGSPGDLERSLNRGTNYVMALRLRAFLARVITRLSDFSAEELDDYLLVEETNKLGQTSRKLSTRCLADLSSAVEKAQAITYLALADTSADRARRESEEAGGDAGGAIHASIAAAMAEVAAPMKKLNP